jgi:hypothetical protein
VIPRGLTRRQVIERLQGERGQALTILPEWEQALAALEDPATFEILLKTVRQWGKSQLLAGIGIAETVTVPGSYVIFVSASESQAGAIYARKIRKPVERLARQLGLAIRTTKRGYEIPSLNSAFEVISPNETTAPARSPTLLEIDEARDIDDAVYETLIPSVVGANGKAVIASTPGRMRGFFYQLVSHPAPGTVLIASTENHNPYANRGVIGFLRERLRLSNPAAEQRELGGEFAEEGGEFLSWALIESAVDPDWHEIQRSTGEAYAALDLSRKKDLTSLVVLIREPARRPEAPDHLRVALLVVWNPAESPTGEVDFVGVRAVLDTLPARFPNLVECVVDEGSEGGSVLPWGRSRPGLTTKMKGVTATVDSNMHMWSALAARLHGQTVSLPRHERLLAELRNLRQEPTMFGSKWRIVDASRRYHRDISAALAMAVAAAGEAPSAGLWFQRSNGILGISRGTPPPAPSREEIQVREEARLKAEAEAQRAIEEREAREIWHRPGAWTNWS